MAPLPPQDYEVLPARLKGTGPGQTKSGEGAAGRLLLWDRRNAMRAMIVAAPPPGAHFTANTRTDGEVLLQLAAECRSIPTPKSSRSKPPTRRSSGLGTTRSRVLQCCGYRWSRCEQPASADPALQSIVDRPASQR